MRRHHLTRSRSEKCRPMCTPASPVRTPPARAAAYTAASQSPRSHPPDAHPSHNSLDTCVLQFTTLSTHPPVPSTKLLARCKQDLRSIATTCLTLQRCNSSLRNMFTIGTSGTLSRSRCGSRAPTDSIPRHTRLCASLPAGAGLPARRRAAGAPQDIDGSQRTRCYKTA